MMKKKKKHLVYHYCSPETFLEIIVNKTIRLSDINKTNDYMEKRWIAQYILSSIDMYLEENGIKIDLDEAYYYDENVKSHREYLISSINEFVCNSNPVLIACFSENADLLSQWRAYASDGIGLAIGFNEELLSRLDRNNASFPNEISYGDIWYDEKIQKSEVKLYITETIIHAKEIYENTALGKQYSSFESYFAEEFDVFCDVLTESISFQSCFFKNPAFQEEEETRIVYDPYVAFDLESSDGKKVKCFTDSHRKGNFVFSPVRNIIKGKRLISYVDLSFAKLIDEGIIGKIMIGPKSEITEFDLECLLGANGYHDIGIDIEKSSASYR